MRAVCGVRQAGKTARCQPHFIHPALHLSAIDRPVPQDHSHCSTADKTPFLPFERPKHFAVILPLFFGTAIMGSVLVVDTLLKSENCPREPAGLSSTRLVLEARQHLTHARAGKMFCCFFACFHPDGDILGYDSITGGSTWGNCQEDWRFYSRHR